jgi:hypothetical protein
VNKINANGDLCSFVNEIRLSGSAIDPRAESLLSFPDGSR